MLLHSQKVIICQKIKMFLKTLLRSSRPSSCWEMSGSGPPKAAGSAPAGTSLTAAWHPRACGAAVRARPGRGGRRGWLLRPAPRTQGALEGK